MADSFQELATTCEIDQLSALLDERYEVQRSWLNEQLEERARCLKLLVEQEVAKNAEAKFHRLHEFARQERNADLLLLRRSLNDLTTRVDGLGLQELRTELHEEVNGLQEQMKAIMLGFGETPDLGPQRMGRLSELLLSNPKEDSMNEMRSQIETISTSMTEFRDDATHRLEALESELKGPTYISAIETQMKHSAEAINRVSDVLAASNLRSLEASRELAPSEASSLHTRLTTAELAIESLVNQFASINTCETKADDLKNHLSVCANGPAFAKIDLECLQSEVSAQPLSSSTRSPPRSPARSPLQSARTTPRCLVRVQRNVAPNAYQLEPAPSTSMAIGKAITQPQAATVTRQTVGTPSVGRESSSRSMGTSPRIGTQASSMLLPARLSITSSSSVTVPCNSVAPPLGTRAASRGSQQVSPYGIPAASSSPPPRTRLSHDFPRSSNVL